MEEKEVYKKIEALAYEYHISQGMERDKINRICYELLKKEVPLLSQPRFKSYYHTLRDDWTTEV